MPACGEGNEDEVGAKGNGIILCSFFLCTGKVLEEFLMLLVELLQTTFVTFCLTPDLGFVLPRTTVAWRMY